MIIRQGYAPTSKPINHLKKEKEESYLIIEQPELLARTTQAQEIVSDAKTNETYLNLQFTVQSQKH